MTNVSFVQVVPPDQNSKSALKHRVYLPTRPRWPNVQTNAVSIAILMRNNVIPPRRIHVPLLN